MNIGVLITSISNFGKKGFYNSQELGLAKALAKKFDIVEVYKLVSIDQDIKTEHIGNYKNAKIHFIPAKNFGINGVIDVTIVNKSLDVLIHFSDTQFSVPIVYKWCNTNKIHYFPYIGVIESHSTSRIKSHIMDLLFNRNLKVYRNCTCFAKTPTIRKKLLDLGVKDVTVTPVGLDLSLLKKDFNNYRKLDLKKKYGYEQQDKVILFIGRLTKEKEPLKMLEIFNEIKRKNRDYKLLMIGNGELKLDVENLINKFGLQNDVRLIDQIPNSDIWELYRISDCFVNLNQQEIFGMAILESMYYGCKVVAWQAPGPNYIIENGVSGCLANTVEEIITGVVNKQISPKISQNRILDSFTWSVTAHEIMNQLMKTKI